MIRLFVQVLLFIFPWSFRRWLLVRLYGFEIDRSARIGMSLLNAKKVRMGKNTRIGHFNVVMRLELLDMEEESCILNLNYIYGVRKAAGEFTAVPDRESSLTLGAHSGLSSRHLIDCTDRVVLEPFSTLGGYRTTVLTHSIDFRTNVQSCGPITIGAYSFIGTNCVILRDAKVPQRSLVAAGAVVTDKVLPSDSLIGGVPAKVIGTIPEDYAYFHRKSGRVE